MDVPVHWLRQYVREKIMASGKKTGKRTIMFKRCPYITGASSVVGEMEGNGPLGKYFDVVEKDPMFGGKTWEEAESRLQNQAAQTVLKNAGLSSRDIDYLVGGDLLGQLIATSFGVEDMGIPFFGVYGACSTMGESLSIASILIDAGYADNVMALTSSHNSSAERQFRFPPAYGNQKPMAATWTVTGSGGVILSSGRAGKKQRETLAGSMLGAIGKEEYLKVCKGKGNTEKENTKKDNAEKGNAEKGNAEKANAEKGNREKGNIEKGSTEKEICQVKITGITTGKIMDYGIKDSMNMGAVMAPAALDLIKNNLSDLDVGPDYYDRIITGDLGKVGKKILLELLNSHGYDIKDRYMDCGMEIYDEEFQDSHSGGSGCGCSAVTLTGYLLRKLFLGEWKRILFVPTGALLSPISFHEGNTVPSIAHGVIIEGQED